MTLIQTSDLFSDAGAVNLNYNGQEIKELGEKGQKKN